MNPLEQGRSAIDAIDQEMAALFVRRMQAVEQIVLYKKQMGLPVLDSGREAALLEKNQEAITDPRFLEGYGKVFSKLLEVSKSFQKEILGE